MTKPILVRVSQSRELLGINKSTIYRWKQKGLLQILNRGGVSVVRVADVEKVLGAED